MAALVKYAKGSVPFAMHLEMIEVEYDFAKDGGATGALDVFKADKACVVMSACMKVDTTATSGGSATVSVGKSGDAAGLVAATAVASIVAGAVISGAVDTKAMYKLAAGDIVQVAIGTAALTAGKLRMSFLIDKF